MIPRTTLLDPVRALLKALTTPTTSPTTTLLSTFTTLPTPLIHEHGLPQLAPFLGRSFTGTDGIARYFQLLSEHLDIKSMTFEPEETWVIDESAMTICLRGDVTLIWKSTQQAWDETFAYRIAVARDVSDQIGKAGELRVWEYIVWADTGAAYLARLGRLGELVGKDSRAGHGDGDGKGIHVGRESIDAPTRGAVDRSKSGCRDVLGGGLNVYGSCG